MKIDKLRNQTKKVIVLLEQQYKKDPSDMLKLIIKRYKRLLDILYLNEEFSSNDFVIKGSVRAYLDSRSDYDNPILEEMTNTEKMFQSIIK